MPRIEIIPPIQNQLSANTKVCIVVVGLATNGTAINNQLVSVKSPNDANILFGAHAAGDTIPRALEVLLQYGCDNIFCIKVPRGADAAATQANIIGAVDVGTGVKTGLELVTDVWSRFGMYADAIITPGQSADAVILRGVDVAERANSNYFSEVAPTTLVSALITTRGLTTGNGLKRQRLVVCYPYLRRASNLTILDPLTLHLAGAIGRVNNYGRPVSSQPLINVDSTELAFNSSLTDQNADNQRLDALGVVTVFRRADNTFATFGNRNSLYPSVLNANSYVNVTRTYDEILALAIINAMPFIDAPSTLGTAKLLEETLDRMLYAEASNSRIASGDATFLDTASDFKAGKLVYRLDVAPFLPNELIQLSVALQI